MGRKVLIAPDSTRNLGIFMRIRGTNMYQMYD